MDVQEPAGDGAIAVPSLTEVVVPATETTPPTAGPETTALSEHLRSQAESLSDPVFGRLRARVESEPGTWSLLAVPVLVCLAMVLFVVIFPTG